MLGTVTKLSFNASDHCRVNPSAPVSRYRAKRAPTGSLGRGYYVRHIELTNHARDVVLINQSKCKLNDDLETAPKISHIYQH